MMIYPWAINTASLGYTDPIEDIIEQIARAGFEGLAPWHRELEGKNVTQIAKQIKDAGLKLSGYCRNVYFPHTCKEEAKKIYAQNKQIIEVAAALEAPSVTLVVGSFGGLGISMSTARAQVLEGISSLLEHAKSHNIILGIEPLHPMYAADRSCICTLEDALHFCEKIDPAHKENLGIIADVYHIWWDVNKEKYLKKAQELRRLISFHICDWHLETKDMLLDRAMMGDGVIPLKETIAYLKEINYQGWLEVEIFSKHHWWPKDNSEILSICKKRIKAILDE